MSASNIDLVVGFDPTGYTSISGAQLAQLVNSAVPYTDKGFSILTTDLAGVPDVPDAATTTKWQRYLWIRLSPLNTAVSLYVWNPSRLFNISYTDGSTNFVQSNWNPVSVATIPPGTIFGFMIAPATITKDKIVSVDVSQVEGLNLADFVQVTTVPTAGDISGTYAVGFTIGNDKVTTAKIANLNVTIAKLDGSEGLADQVLYNIGAATVDWQYVYNLLASQTAKVTPVGTDYVQLLDSADGFLGKKVLVSNLSAYLNTLTSSRFTSTPATAVNSGVQLAATAHGLKVNGVDTRPSRLFAYLVNTNAANAQGYAVGDAVPYTDFAIAASGRPAYTIGASSTQVWAASDAAGAINVMFKNGSNTTNITLADWNFVLVAEI